MIEALVVLIVATFCFFAGRFSAQRHQIDYKKRWQEATALLQDDSTDWSIENDIRAGVSDRTGKNGPMLVVVLRKGDKTIDYPFNDAGTGLMLGGKGFATFAAEYRKNAEEAAKLL
jgi:hypothetical protein